MLQVTLIADGQGAGLGAGHEGKLQTVTTSITGRNTGIPYPGENCNDSPTYP
jgi:hypothetical protein